MSDYDSDIGACIYRWGS